MNDFITIESVGCTYGNQDRYHAPLSIAYSLLMEYAHEDRDQSQMDGILRILSHRKICSIHDNNFHYQYLDLMKNVGEFSESQMDMLNRNLDEIIKNDL